MIESKLGDMMENERGLKVVIQHSGQCFEATLITPDNLTIQTGYGSDIQSAYDDLARIYQKR